MGAVGKLDSLAEIRCGLLQLVELEIRPPAVEINFRLARCKQGGAIIICHRPRGALVYAAGIPAAEITLVGIGQLQDSAPVIRERPI
jgi:hypothetical protein